MKRNEHPLDEFFRSKLMDFEQSPSPYVWDRIQERQSSWRKKRLVLFLRASGIAAVIVFAFLLGREWQAERTIRDNGSLADQSETFNQKQPVLDEVIQPAEPVVSSEDALAVMERSTSREKIVSDTAVLPNDQKGGQLPVERPGAPALLSSRSAQLNVPQMADLSLACKKEWQKTVVDVLSQNEMALVEYNKEQERKAEVDKPDQSWSVGAMVAPVYAVSQTSYEAVYASNMTRSAGNGHVQMGGGLTIEYAAGKRWAVQTGLYYSQLNESSGNAADSYRMNMAFADAGSDYFNTPVTEKRGVMQINASAGVVEVDELPSSADLSASLERADASQSVLLSQANFEQQFEYVEVPLLVSYRVIDKGFRMSLQGGLNAGFLVGNNVFMESADGQTRIGKTKDMSSISYSTTIGLGFGYQLTDRLEFRFDPQLKYFIGSLSDNPSVSFKPYSIGLYTGIKYRF